MAKGNDIEIKDALTPWEGYAKKRVEEYLKNRLASIDAALSGKCGAVHISDEMTSEGYYELWTFACEDDYAAYRAAEDKTDPEVAKLLKSREIIPISAEQADVVMVSLSRAEGQESSVMALDGRVVLSLDYSSIRYNPADKTTEDNGETATLTVQARTSDAQPWSVIKTLGNVEPGRVDIDLSDLLTKEVTYRIRVQAVGADSGKMSVWVNFASVIRTDVSLSLDTDVSAAQQPVNGLQLDFRHTGSVNRTLNVRVYDAAGASMRLQSIPLGNSPSGDSTTKVTFRDTAADTVKVTSAGVHRVEAYISVDDRPGVTTDTLKAQVIMAGGNVPIVSVNEAAASLVNWGEGVAARYAVWAPAGYGEVAIRFALESESGTVYWSREVTAASGASDAIVATPEIDGISDDTIAAHLRVYVAGAAAPVHDSVVSIDNSRSLAPVAGASFLLDPRTRDNYTNPTDIYNAVTGRRVDAQFDNMVFSTASGWIADSAGARCLRIPAGSRLTISALAPFADLAPSSGVTAPAMTLELDICIRNIADADPVLLSAATGLSAGTLTIPVGLELRGLVATVMSSAATDRNNQDVALMEGVRRHVAVNILPDLRGEGVNYVRVFVDGIITREFAYSAPADFSAAADAPLVIGGEGADIDIYGIRFYRSGLGEADIRRNRIATEASLDKKLAMAADNAIVDGSGAISYDAAKGKLPTLLWSGSRETRYGDTKKTAFTGNMLIDFPGDPGHSGLLTNLTVKGQGTSSMTYYRWNQGYTFGDDSVWTDGNGVQHTDGYRLRPGLPAARKLVGKVNYASSPQTHKMGSCELYDTLWKRIIKSNGYITEEDRSLRVAVPQEPVLFFVQESENDTPRFAGLMTFGPGKGDKPTFGFGTDRPGYLCVEGADNGRDVLMCRVPWSDDVTLDDEDFIYAGQKQLSVVGGVVSDDNIAKFRAAFNFCYRHFPDIARWEGDSTSLYQSAAADKTKHYWLDGAAALAAGERDTLHRYDPASGKWVPAGDVRVGGTWATVTLDRSGSTAEGDALTAYYRDVRLQDFKAHASEYFNIREMLFVMCFLKLIAASDNRGKNTYLYIRSDGMIGFHQDDLDTIFATNNTGQRLKPYWCEEHDRDSAGGCYWNSEGNAMYNLFELAYDSELREMMRDLLDALVAVARDHGGSAPADAFDALYFNRVADVFPAVAYNENARISYEAAATAMHLNQYSNGTDPLSQSLGNQIDAERQWVRQRLTYIASWCAWGEFASRDGAGASGSLNFRSTATPDGGQPSYAFDLTAHSAVYPTFALGNSLTRGTADGMPRRLMEGETARFDIGSTDGNTNMFVNGINALRSVGDFTSVSLTGRLTVASDSLQSFAVDAADAECCFRATSMEFVTPMLTTLRLYGASTVGGTLDLSACTRLRELDLRGTSITSLILPDGGALRSVKLPATLASLSMRNAKHPSLSLTLQGGGSLRSIDLTGSSQNVQLTVLSNCAGNSMSVVRLGAVSYMALPLATMRTIASADIVDVSGRIAIVNTTANQPTFDDKMQWLAHWGNVDSETNSLYVTYMTTPLTSVMIQGNGSPSMAGTYKFALLPTPAKGNDVTRVEWTVERVGGSDGYLVSSDAMAAMVNTGTFSEYASAEDIPATPPELIITATVTKADGTELTASATLACYIRPARPGDYVFYDGSCGPHLTGKTVVGICVYVNESNPSQRLCLQIGTFSNLPWGMHPGNWNGFSLSDQNKAYNVYAVPGIRNDEVVITDSLVNAETGKWAVFDPATDARGEIGWVALEEDMSSIDPMYPAGTLVPYGMMQTLKILKHRDFILSDANTADFPTIAEKSAEMQGATEYEVLSACMAYANTKRGGGVGQQIYFPASSVPFAWQPSNLKDGEVLAECFTRHHWYLPSAGEMARIVFYLRKRANAVYAGNESEHDIFKRAADDMQLSETYCLGPNLWTSTQWGGDAAVYKLYGVCENKANPSARVSLNPGAHSYVVRALAAF